MLALHYCRNVSFKCHMLLNMTWVFTLCSMEAKHSVKGSMETALKVTNDLHGALQLCVSSSHIRDCNRWGLTYRCAFCSPILCHFVIQEVFVMNLINCQFGPDYLLDHNACTGIVMAKSIL
jgi:hypothetical protein